MPANHVIQSSLADYFRMVQSRVHELTASLSTEQLWHRPYAYGNSIGNLILHLTGNLNYYIGAQMADTGYVRHRDLEFSAHGKPKDDLLREFDLAIETVVKTTSGQSEDDWAAPYAAERTQVNNRFAMFLNCAGHAYHHVGQIIYLQRELLRQG